MGFTRRNLLSGLLSLGLTSCLGSFEIVHLNDASVYERAASQEDVQKINFAHLNAADLRGNTPNLFEIISEEEARYHAQWLANFLQRNQIDIVDFNELDYVGTLKTGGLDQPLLIAEYLGPPYNYVVFDQYLKSPLWTTGNSIISNRPTKLVHRHLYGEEKCALDGRLEHLFKDFIHVKVRVGQKELDVISTHLDNEGGDYKFRRKEEAQELAHYVREFIEKNPQSYIVVAGDLNDGYDSETMKIILSSGLQPPAENFGLKTHQNGNPTNDLDHILGYNVTIRNYRTFVFPWSDHLGLMCELEFLK